MGCQKYRSSYDNRRTSPRACAYLQTLDIIVTRGGVERRVAPKVLHQDVIEGRIHQQSTRIKLIVGARKEERRPAVNVLGADVTTNETQYKQ